MKLVAPVIKAAKNYHNKMQFQARFVYTKYYDTLSIDDNAVLVESFNGDDMNGSPFYILKELCENERYQHLKKYVTVHNGSRKRITALIEAQIDNHEDIVYVTKHSDEYCRLLASAKYLVTNVTFPTYFIKGTQELAAQTKLDATVFATRIAPALNITVRFVGDEPTDKTTLAYNRAMKEVFGSNGLELKVIPREQKGEQVVSASSVRRALAEDDWETVRRMVPRSTLTYLQSEAGEAIINKIKLMAKLNQKI